MGTLIDNFAFAEAAYLYHDRNIPYKQLDCQAFVERVLVDCGVYRNWRGSNHMWREALSWKGTIDEAVSKWGSVPVGAWLFTVRHDGGEVKRGYHDDQGNAAHVGIFTAKGKGAMHSTTGGVQECAFPDRNRWTHCGLANDIDYRTIPDEDTSIDEELTDIINRLISLKGRLLK